MVFLRLCTWRTTGTDVQCSARNRTRNLGLQVEKMPECEEPRSRCADADGSRHLVGGRGLGAQFHISLFSSLASVDSWRRRTDGQADGCERANVWPRPSSFVRSFRVLESRAFLRPLTTEPPMPGRRRRRGRGDRRVGLQAAHIVKSNVA